MRTRSYAKPSTGGNYWVSPTGSNGAAGSQAAPWLTWEWAVDHVAPGDTIHILPGVYSPTGAQYGCSITINGTAAAPITLQGYGRPVLNAAGVTGTGNKFGLALMADWWILKDIDVTGTPQASSSVTGMGLYLDTSNSVIQNVRSYGNQGAGFLTELTSGNNLFLNCDAYDNYDPLSAEPGNNADGMVLRIDAGFTGNVVDGCRAWNNSDDGFDLWESEVPVTIRNCWSFSNGGYNSGNGTGFKLGRNDTSPLHLIHRNIGAFNTSYGFATNFAAGPLQLYNNTAYGNLGLEDAVGSPRDYAISVGPGIAHVFRNNIHLVTPAFPAETDDEYNSWNLGVTVSAADFLSTSVALGSAPRQPDGSLPVNDFFRLAPGSDLIDAGTNVGFPYTGAAPDLGAYERP